MAEIVTQAVSEIYHGSQAIKEAYAGEDLVFSRPGGYCIITLYGTQAENTAKFTPKDSTGLICADGAVFYAISQKTT